MSTARALYDYTDDPNNQHQLRFVVGEIITVTEKRDDGWWGGILNGVEGFFPASYVQVLGNNHHDFILYVLLMMTYVSMQVCHNHVKKLQLLTCACHHCHVMSCLYIPR